MTKKSTKDIISSYMGNEVPQQVRENFEDWITSPENLKEKSDILEDIWNSIPESGKVSGLPSAGRIIKEGEAIGMASGKPRIKDMFLWISSAAAVILAVICTTLLFSGKEVINCIASSESSKSHFTLPDGTDVWLNRNSRLYYSGSLNGKERKVMLIGEGFFDVEPDKSRPFTVEAHDLDITVLGTEFTVTAYSGDMITAYLSEGSIRVSGPGLNNGTVLSPDQSLTFNRLKGTYSRNTVNAHNHTAWKEDRLSFQDSSLQDIMESLSHWYNVNITCNDEAFTKNTKLTLTVRQEPITDILDLIQALVPDMSYSFDDGRNLLISPK